MKRHLWLICLFLVPFTRAQAAAVQLSLIPDVALHGKNTYIEGFILNIWGQNPQTAFAIGLVNGSTEDSSGLSLALIANYTESYTGAHLAFFNYASERFTGLQWGAINFTESLKGVQLGVVNYAGTVSQGVQIGLVNVISQNKTWFGDFPDAVAPFFIVANWRFQ